MSGTRKNTNHTSKLSEELIKKKVLEIIADEYIKKTAEIYGITAEKCRYEIEYAIKKTSKNPNTYFIELFGNRTPSVEEFIFKILVIAEEEEHKNNA